MLSTFLKAVFGSRNERLLKQYRATVVRINALEATLDKLSDEALAAKTPELKAKVAAGAKLDDILPEAFAVVREASKRVLGMRHFDEQMIGGIALHEGKIAEMRTGEGKTLVATLPSYLNALEGKGVHVVTVNDYLAKRDAEWMGRIHRFMGLTVGVVVPGMEHADKQAAYKSDITYGTNNEFGFDYLRDNMATQVAERFQNGLNFAIVDEVDSILIDEARTPLIISGQAEDSTELYRKINVLIPKLVPQADEKASGDYYVDLKQHSVTLSEEGHEHAEELMRGAGLLAEGASLYDPSNIMLMHHLYAGVRAHSLYHRDQHYVVQDDEVVIVDEFTGRMMAGRRWSDGLHQAVEAKEGASIKNESQTLASITFQNYFRLYKKLAGMTGTADTEAFEFSHIYNLETVLIPTHRKMVRADRNDQVFITANEKHQAIINDVKDCHARGQPVLLGTTSIENSELLAELLDKQKLPHQVLNAKQHAKEAQIVTQAGRPGMITIATNMAGRGTDIVLGGNPDPEIQSIKADESLDASTKEARVAAIRSEWEKLHAAVVAAGGLHIIGSERHESRRIDNQLRGRSGRQGDPGSSRFYLSFEDPLLKIFAGERLKSIMGALKIPEGEAIEAKMVSRSIENAQRKVEARNFDIRKQLLEYDDVASDQRKVIYQQRNELLESEDISETISSIRRDVLQSAVLEQMPADTVEEQWDIPALERRLESEFYQKVPVAQWLSEDPQLDAEKVTARLVEQTNADYGKKFDGIEPSVIHHYERAVMLQSIDSHWREHLAALDYLRQGIHLRGYAQKQPKQEYKREAFELFGTMLDSIKREVTRHLMSVQVRSQEQVEQAEREAEEAAARAVKNVQYHHPDASSGTGEPEDEPPQGGAAGATEEPVQPFVRSTQKVGRNDPCPCGSGKKYKQCHGKID
ncbi:preprotein translocase subunit SecA [Usitatibacter palustris]|uniref:Protein translocase subunit SecA n=1 Tax=Usitatibacter palustris TaxID=2732487 RepID=A0A6M4H5R5_9PROT|nr:preprotein translocase subunit SecA [Usitatibacter palustris]QJR13864.1 Protein translocase subunit SecA [Usitatibacter palustris]